jgi:carboxypeptidase Taq
MDPTTATQRLLERMREVDRLNTIAGVLGWDQETGMPAANAPYRGEQLSLLSGLSHERFTDPLVGELLEEASRHPEAQREDSDLSVNLREWRRDFDRARRLPKDLVEEMSRVTSEAQVAWVEARSQKDFALFQPHLERVVALSRRQADHLGWAEHPYDALLEEYEPGLTTADLERLFPPLLERLSALVKAIQGSARQPDKTILRRRVSVRDQQALGRRLAEALGFDFSRGRLDVSAHPFTTGLGPDDTRITTRYDETDFSNALFSVLHETGHGLYDQGLPGGDATGTPRGSAVSLGIHESQSRLWENLVGRSHGFWRYFYPIFREGARDAFQDVPLDDFFHAINQSGPSLIRTEADEVTYNLHIGLRVDLEKSLIKGDLRVADIPEAWGAATNRYLGLRVPDDSLGCLQDVHWSHGSFGYFPTYTLGNLYAAQFFEAAHRELGDLETAFAQGDFRGLLGYLREKIHHQGKRHRAHELCRQVTGAPLSPEPYLDHLRKKFTALYDLS